MFFYDIKMKFIARKYFSTLDRKIHFRDLENFKFDYYVIIFIKLFLIITMMKCLLKIKKM